MGEQNFSFGLLLKNELPKFFSQAQLKTGTVELGNTIKVTQFETEDSSPFF